MISPGLGPERIFASHATFGIENASQPAIHPLHHPGNQIYLRPSLSIVLNVLQMYASMRLVFSQSLTKLESSVVQLLEKYVVTPCINTQIGNFCYPVYIDFQLILIK